ncbi:MAG: transposase [Chitinophagaceae bacterium]|nr:MAG: transposase [Chitinophagaceae bacterium]
MASVDGHLNALWYLLRNGCAWRALPSKFGPWRVVHQYFNRLLSSKSLILRPLKC